MLTTRFPVALVCFVWSCERVDVIMAGFGLVFNSTTFRCVSSGESNRCENHLRFAEPRSSDCGWSVAWPSPCLEEEQTKRNKKTRTNAAMNKTKRKRHDRTKRRKRKKEPIQIQRTANSGRGVSLPKCTVFFPDWAGLLLSWSLLSSFLLVVSNECSFLFYLAVVTGFFFVLLCDSMST